MYTIGEFSKIGQVSAKMLRHYNKIGLLLPQEVDRSNRYRYYSKEQVEDIIMIKKLKSYKFSLLEIKELLDSNNPIVIKEAMTHKLINMEEELHQYQLLIEQMREEIHRLNKGVAMFTERSFDMVVEERKGVIYVSLRDRIDISEVGNLFNGAIKKMSKHDLKPEGPMMAKYYEEEFDSQNVDIEICVPVDRYIEGITASSTSQLCVSTEFNGPYSEISQAYAALFDYFKKNNLKLQKPTYEVYIVGPDSGVESRDFVTRIYFPIKSN